MSALPKCQACAVLGIVLPTGYHVIQILCVGASDFFDKSFWQQFVITAVGVVLGIPSGLWLNRRVIRWGSNADAAKAVERQQYVLDLLDRAVRKNIALLRQMSTDLNSQVIFYNVDLSVFESLPSTEIMQSGGLVLSEKLGHLRYELAHLHRKVELQLTIAFDGPLQRLVVRTVPGGRNLTEYDQMRDIIVGAIKQHLPPTIKACDDALTEIERIRDEVDETG